MDEEQREEQAETEKLHKSKDVECCQAPRMPEKDLSCKTMSDYLTPAMFDMVLCATIEVSGGTEESFLHPSTTLK